MPDKPAQTAYGVMIQIAMEQFLPESHRIVDDRLAYRMLPRSMQLLTQAMGFALIKPFMFNLFERQTPGIRNSILSRKRYIDDRLLEALDAGIGSVVILGAVIASVDLDTEVVTLVSKVQLNANGRNYFVLNACR